MNIGDTVQLKSVGVRGIAEGTVISPEFRDLRGNRLIVWQTGGNTFVSHPDTLIVTSNEQDKSRTPIQNSSFNPAAYFRVSDNGEQTGGLGKGKLSRRTG